MTTPTSRRAFVTAATLALAGCSSGESESTQTGGSSPTPTGTENPAVGDVEQRGAVTLSSDAFADGTTIPVRYSRDGENVNPPLSIGSVPDGAETLTLVVDDPDAVDVAGEVFLHWLVWNVPATRTTIPAGWEPADAVVGTNDFDNRRYDGPDPPDGEHSYRFKLYALDTALDIPRSASKREVGTAMRGQIVAQTQLTGTYAP